MKRTELIQTAELVRYYGATDQPLRDYLVQAHDDQPWQSDDEIVDRETSIERLRRRDDDAKANGSLIDKLIELAPAYVDRYEESHYEVEDTYALRAVQAYTVAHPYKESDSWYILGNTPNPEPRRGRHPETNLLLWPAVKLHANGERAANSRSKPRIVTVDTADFAARSEQCEAALTTELTSVEEKIAFDTKTQKLIVGARAYGAGMTQIERWHMRPSRSLTRHVDTAPELPRRIRASKSDPLPKTYSIPESSSLPYALSDEMLDEYHVWDTACHIFSDFGLSEQASAIILDHAGVEQVPETIAISTGILGLAKTEFDSLRGAAARVKRLAIGRLPVGIQVNVRNGNSVGYGQINAGE